MPSGMDSYDTGKQDESGWGFGVCAGTGTFPIIAAILSHTWLLSWEKAAELVAPGLAQSWGGLHWKLTECPSHHSPSSGRGGGCDAAAL